jgi:hypothetical protein
MRSTNDQNSGKRRAHCVCAWMLPNNSKSTHQK